MERVNNVFRQLGESSCTVDGAASGLSNPLTEFVNEILGLKSGTQACSLKESIKRVDNALNKMEIAFKEAKEGKSSAPSLGIQQKYYELMDARKQMELVRNRYERDPEFKKEVDTMDKAWKAALKQDKKEKHNITKTWYDPKLEQEIAYYRKHKYFLFLPSDAQYRLMYPHRYKKSVIEKELEWLGKPTRGMRIIEPYQKKKQQKLAPIIKSKI